MKLKKYLFAFAAVAAVAFTACSDDDKTDPFALAPEPPCPNITPEPPTIKPKAMWIDCHANFQLLSTKKNIDAELQKIHDHGFNLIYLDVKPSNGYALYKSDILPYCNTFMNLTVTRDYDDFLGYFLTKCEELDIDVVASLTATGVGAHSIINGVEYKQGLCYDNWAKWGKMLQVRSDLSTAADDVVNIADDATQTVVMFDPMYQEAQDWLIEVISELVTKYSTYPKFKGISLDYLRYCNNDGGYYGMSDDNMRQYAEYWGESVPKREEIVTATGGVGPKYAKWLEMRSMTVKKLLERIRNTAKAIDPDCEIHLWASADWGTRYTIGQNWASTKYKPSGFQYTDTYNETGFAELLDVFVLGAYAEKVWLDPTTRWTVENFVNSYNDYLMNACTCYGSIAAYAHDTEAVADATYLCLKRTDGFMAFELSHVNNGSLWLGIEKGMHNYEGALSEEEEETEE